jgi:hypothetical protein
LRAAFVEFVLFGNQLLDAIVDLRVFHSNLLIRTALDPTAMISPRAMRTHGGPPPRRVLLSCLPVREVSSYAQELVRLVAWS